MPNTSDSFDLLTQREAAAMLRMSEAWFEKRRWKKNGIPYVKIGNKVFYQKSDLLDWLKHHKNHE